MKKVFSIAPVLLLLLGPIHSVPAQGGGGSSQDLKALAKSVATGSSAQKTAESDEGASEKTVSADSLSAQKYYDSGILAYEAGRLDEAVEAFKRAIKLTPDDPQTHYMLGMAYSKSKVYKESFESFKRAARLKADWPEAHFRLGIMSYVLGRWSQSVEAYNNLLRLGSPLANTLHRIIKENNNQASAADKLDAASWSLRPAEVAPATAPAKEATNATVDKLNQVPSTGDATSPSVKPAAASVDATPIASGPPAAADDSTLTRIYRIGVGDVLDIRLLNSSTPRSTLYTVIDGGLIDLAVAGGPIAVAGLTADEIQARVASELKRRAVEEGARVSVGVRQYASHSVIITGLVNNPGAKFLRREAVPLYVIMAEAQARLDAGRVTIMRTGSAGLTLDLGNPAALNFIIRSGDIISVTSRPQEYYYIGGRINYPGQKVFQPGITLLQAILAAGGLMRQSDNLVELSREGQDGRLATTTFKLKEIKTGKIQDPRLQPGDRIEIVR